MANEERLTVKACPRCGHRLLAAGRPFKITTPAWFRRWEMRHPIGVSCISCGYWKRSLRAWNKAAAKKKTCGNCRHNRVPGFGAEIPCPTCISGLEKGKRLGPTMWEPKEE